MTAPEDAIREGMEILQAVTPTDTEAAIALIGISDTLDLY